MLSQTTRGLIAIGAGDSDIRVRFLKYAADFFGLVAKGEAPPNPEPFVAELVAETCAKAVGAEVPMPIDAAPVAGRTLPGSTIVESPEAASWLVSHGYGHGRKPYPNTRLIMSVFLQNPHSWWRTREINKRLGKTKGTVVGVLTDMKKAGLIVSEGIKSGCKYKLADMPPHV